MAGQIRLKLGGMIKGMQENVLAKEFFGSVEVDRGQVSGPQVPLPGHGDDKEIPNRACWNECTGIDTWTPASLGGYVTPVVAAVPTNATDVRHIYLINDYCQCLSSPSGEMLQPRLPLFPLAVRPTAFQSCSQIGRSTDLPPLYFGYILRAVWGTCLGRVSLLSQNLLSTYELMFLEKANKKQSSRRSSSTSSHDSYVLKG